MQHISQIKAALQIAGVSSNEYSFVVRGDSSAEGMQIDLVIDRADDVVNVCEMKFCKSPFTVTKSYFDVLHKRLSYLESLRRDKAFNMTLVTTEPLHRNEYSDVFASTVTLDDLFG